MSTKTARNIREPLKKPRPLKPDSVKYPIHDPKEAVVNKSMEDMMIDLETLNKNISHCNFDNVTASDISRMCAILEKRGKELDNSNKETIDRYMNTLRNVSREERLDLVSRLKLMQTIEIRAGGWEKTDYIQNYYNAKILDAEQGGQDLTLSSSMTSVPFALQNQNIFPLPLAPGEILKSSGKFAKPTKIAGKNVLKDEILIRNSDSGKVNPGARDRLVQITGPHEEAIGHAKLLVEDTIRRNASPIRENSDIALLDNTKDSLECRNSYSSVDNQMFMKSSLQHSYSLSDATLREHTVSVQIDQDLIQLTGTNADLLKKAKAILIEYFARETEINEKQHESYPTMIRQISPDRSKLSFSLQRQLSLKGNVDNIQYGTSNYPLKGQSVSPFSSFEDDFVKDDKRVDEDNNQFIPDTSLPTDVKHRTLESSNIHGQLMRRSSVCNDFRKGFPEMYSPVNDQVFSPMECEVMPIPPPTSKKLRRYSRESLLNLATSPLSHNQPLDYAHIHQHFQDIVCQSPVMFDPQKFKELCKKSEDALQK